eukprot:CAMPEP_0180033992 /NCGR_PEP_ID=MMETSP0984-20121128/29344_1 /TAXON_ID=483367 /ORGANISM="non described non described, Strain CCMP 2436" /LENGTH=78 /DNA_ID=CAMNT_0021959447 /DNA_START=471 /DNA_END=707 /DNA_ORIENTATION=-
MWGDIRSRGLPELLNPSSGEKSFVRSNATPSSKYAVDGFSQTIPIFVGDSKSGVPSIRAGDFKKAGTSTAQARAAAIM